MRVCVTGAAGFIGSHMVDRLLALGHSVVGYDNFSTGQRQFLEQARRNPRFELVEGDLLTDPALDRAFAGADVVVHFAANADVRFGTEHPRKDLEQNTMVTFNVLESARQAGVPRFVFSSTGSVYGEPAVFPTPEDAPFPVQTSLYGASKLAGEGLVAAYSEGFGLQAWIFRFVSVLGERYSHGHVFDFCRQLFADPSVLHVLGDGKQRKSYLHVQDCIDAILVALEHRGERLRVFNLGTQEFCRVTDSIAWITSELDVAPRLEFSGGERGWVGDSPFIFLDTARIRALGWRPRHSVRQGIEATVRYLSANRWIFGVRS